MLYWFGKFFLTVFFKSFCKIKYFDQQKVPEDRGIIIASNHVSYYDPFAVGTGLKHKIHWMAKKELFEEKFIGPLISIMASFPVDRDGIDRNAIKEAIDIIKKGEVLGIFPEGTRSSDGVIGEGQKGAAMLSVMSGAPIVPAALVGSLNCRIRTFPFPKFKRIFVKYGDPIYPEQFEGKKKDKLDKITDKTMESIRKLKEELEAEWVP